ncbi:MAG TPA: hypothetical protein VF590_07425, partial [Isosphaeraceae bacterium]
MIFGGQDRDVIIGGQGGDIIFGDRGRVEYTDAQGRVVAVLGHGGPGDRTDGKVRAPSRIYTVDDTIGGNDTIDGSTIGNGAATDTDIIFGGGNDDALKETNPETLRGGEDNDILIGDYGMVTLFGGLPTRIETTSVQRGGNDVISGGSGDDFVLAGYGRDQIAGDAGRDVLFGDNGIVTFLGTFLATIATTDPAIGDV